MFSIGLTTLGFECTWDGLGLAHIQQLLNFEECLAQTTLEQEKITATHMAFSAHGKATVEI